MKTKKKKRPKHFPTVDFVFPPDNPESFSVALVGFDHYDRRPLNFAYRSSLFLSVFVYSTT